MATFEGGGSPADQASKVVDTFKEALPGVVDHLVWKKDPITWLTPRQQEAKNIETREFTDAFLKLTPAQQHKLGNLADDVALNRGVPAHSKKESFDKMKKIEDTKEEIITQILIGKGTLPQDIVDARSELYASDFDTAFEDSSQSWTPKVQYTPASSTQETGMSPFDEMIPEPKHAPTSSTQETGISTFDDLSQ